MLAVNHHGRAERTAGVATIHRAGPASGALEAAFDVVLPVSVRRCAPHFWTPVEVARRAAAFLASDRSARILDVGSGVGKFCIVGALTTGASFTGIEQRPHLVEIANRAARELQAPDVHFVAGTIEDVNWSSFDGFYFFNPFEENIFREQGCFDRSVVLSEERFWKDVAFIEGVLASAAVGTRVATFHGFGGRIPDSYALVDQQAHRGGILRFWTKVSAEQTSDSGILEDFLPLEVPFEDFSVGESG
jgi:SAM-dependent methyltransferase